MACRGASGAQEKAHDAMSGPAHVTCCAHGYRSLRALSAPGHALTGVRDKTAAEKRAGWGDDFAQAIVDDHSRLAYVELLPDEPAPTVTRLRDPGA